MQRSQLNDLFQAALVLGLAALFGAAVLHDLRAPRAADEQIAAAQPTAAQLALRAAEAHRA